MDRYRTDFPIILSVPVSVEDKRHFFPKIPLIDSNGGVFHSAGPSKFFPRRRKI